MSGNHQNLLSHMQYQQPITAFNPENNLTTSNSYVMRIL